jgi:hypothetical protein
MAQFSPADAKKYMNAASAGRLTRGNVRFLGVQGGQAGNIFSPEELRGVYAHYGITPSPAGFSAANMGIAGQRNAIIGDPSAGVQTRAQTAGEYAMSIYTKDNVYSRLVDTLEAEIAALERVQGGGSRKQRGGARAREVAQQIAGVAASAAAVTLSNVGYAGGAVAGAAAGAGAAVAEGAIAGARSGFAGAKYGLCVFAEQVVAAAGAGAAAAGAGAAAAGTVTAAAVTAGGAAAVSLLSATASLVGRAAGGGLEGMRAAVSAAPATTQAVFSAAIAAAGSAGVWSAEMAGPMIAAGSVPALYILGFITEAATAARNAVAAAGAALARSAGAAAISFATIMSEASNAVFSPIGDALTRELTLQKQRILNAFGVNKGVVAVEAASKTFTRATYDYKSMAASVIATGIVLHVFGYSTVPALVAGAAVTALPALATAGVIYKICMYVLPVVKRSVQAALGITGAATYTAMSAAETSVSEINDWITATGLVAQMRVTYDFSKEARGKRRMAVPSIKNVVDLMQQSRYKTPGGVGKDAALAQVMANDPTLSALYNGIIISTAGAPDPVGSATISEVVTTLEGAARSSPADAPAIAEEGSAVMADRAALVAVASNPAAAAAAGAAADAAAAAGLGLDEVASVHEKLEGGYRRRHKKTRRHRKTYGRRHHRKTKSA